MYQITQLSSQLRLFLDWASPASRPPNTKPRSLFRLSSPPPRSPMATELGNGWVQAPDPGCPGRMYYANTITGVTSWEYPTDCTVPEGGEEAGPEPPAVELPHGWVAAIDPGSGCKYYCNTVTVRGGWVVVAPDSPSFPALSQK